MSEYDNVPGGSLRLKGGTGNSNKIKKKKKKSHKDEEKLRTYAKELVDDKEIKPIRVVTKTEAEKKFEEIQAKRLEEKVQKAARKSHKERVAELNRKLEEMTEHYDIPKVGPG
ncbi:6664_t:CDS:2 [Acaulospora morrowiae]|uniref:6664_t:CDS:1 n=1 Tax=Acaulospora morrowiae TaxID=94023 RepID=A0A9N9I273_9GLOM|nr:6664_t:CDS:2 [Acaulospora morrowiae]